MRAKYAMRWMEILNESVKKYMPMFSMFADEDGRMPEWVSSRIRSVENILQREDRVVWALRWERVIAVQRHEPITRGNPDLVEKKLIADLGVLDQDRYAECQRYEAMMRDYFAHWLSMPIEPLHRYVFGRQAPGDVWEDLSAMEDDWTKKRNQIINHEKHYSANDSSDEEEDDEDYDDYDDEGRGWRERQLDRTADIEKIIDFGDGWAWWNLHRTSCSVEGAAMGHCGNGPSRKVGDEVLSLRRDLGNGNFRPSLTFILHNNFMLGEMKGRANEKPNAKYHPYIIRLLMDPLIKGCEGGGYAASNNFTVLDLPDDVREDLINKKPRLMTGFDWLTLYRKDPTSKENTDAMTQWIKNDLSGHGFHYQRFDFTTPTPSIIIRDLGDRTKVVQDRDFPVLYRLGQFFEELQENLGLFTNLSPLEAGEISADAYKYHFNHLFDALTGYSAEADFLIDGVVLEIVDGRVVVSISFADYLNPSSYQLEHFGDPEDADYGRPVLDQITDLEATNRMENNTSWSDVSDSIEQQLDDNVSAAIAQYIFTETHADMLTALNMLITDHENIDNLPYHSDHPDQLSLDLPDGRIGK